MTAGEVWLGSTPYGKQGYFWEAFNEAYNLQLAEARFKVFYTTTEKVVQEREITSEWTEAHREKVLKTLEQDKRTMSRLEYGQEYQGLFMEDLMQFFPDDLINQAQILNRPEGIRREFDHFAGQDIARMGEDQTATAIGYLVNDELFQVENLVTTKTFLTDTFKQNQELNRIYNFNRFFIDDEGIGVGVMDMMMDDDDLKWITIGINNSKRVIDRDGKEKGILKTELYYHLRGLLEQNKIHLLKDETIFNSLKSVQYEYTMDVKGNPQIRIFGNNTHIAEALIRLAQATKTKGLNIGVWSIKI
jgi:hypothetical protein